MSSRLRRGERFLCWKRGQAGETRMKRGGDRSCRSQRVGAQPTPPGRLSYRADTVYVVIIGER